jgi:microcystin-dependent protein
MSRPKVVQARVSFLSSPITAVATTFTINRLVDLYGNVLAMADFADIGYVTIDPGLSTEEIVSFTAFTVNDNGSVTFTGVTRALKGQSDYGTGGTASGHSGGAIVVVSNNPQIYEAILDYIDSVAIAGGADASLTGKGFLEVATETEIDNDEDFGSTGAYVAVTPVKLALSKYGLRLPTASGKIFLDAMTGTIHMYGAPTVPTGFLACDGTAYNNDDYPALAVAIRNHHGQNTGTTATADAGTDFLTAVSHGLDNGDILFFTTTTTLPAGISANTPYYVINKTTNTFQISTSSGGSNVDITDAGTGTHSFHTQFKVPDLRDRFPLGYSASAPTKVFTFVSRSSNDITVSGMSNSAHNELQTGQAVLYTAASGAMTGLTHNTTYYLIRVAYNQFKLATSVANANAGTAISLSSDGTGVQTFTATYTARTVGEQGGEETHALTDAELPSHSHLLRENNDPDGSGQEGVNTDDGDNYLDNQNLGGATSGSDTVHNNMPMFSVVNFIIKT